jgi:hypothetical protein
MMKMTKEQHTLHAEFIVKFMELELEAMTSGLHIFLKPLNECKNRLGDNLAAALTGYDYKLRDHRKE